MKILGIDYGTKNTGFAIGVNGVTSPLNIIKTKGIQYHQDIINEIDKIIRDEKIELIVIGMPYMKNHHSIVIDQIKSIYEKIKNELDFHNITFIDEYKTSDEALKTMVGMGYSQKARKVDHGFAAQILLDRYFEESRL